MDPVIIALRLLVPLTIFHFPFWGGLASMWLDGIDWSVNLFHVANIHADYVVLDKILDIYYLAIEAFVVFRWRNLLAKKIALSLFLWRALGTAIFLITKSESWLFIFPNIFENFFIFYYAVWTLGKREPKISDGFLYTSIFVLGIPKLVQEYVMHVELISNWRPIHISFLPFSYDNLYGQLAIEVIWILIVYLFGVKKKVHS